MATAHEMAVSFAPGTMMLHSAEDALVHEIAEIFAEFVQSKGAKSKADSAYIKRHRKFSSNLPLLVIT